MASDGPFHKGHVGLVGLVGFSLLSWIVFLAGLSAITVWGRDTCVHRDWQAAARAPSGALFHRRRAAVWG